MELIEEKILRPLQMESSFFVVPPYRLKDLAQGIGGGPFGEEELDLEQPQREHPDRGYKVPNGGLYSTPTDLVKFMMANMGYVNLLEKKYLDMMHSKQTPEKSYHGYGLGFELYQDPVMTITGHSGGVIGYSANTMFEKECHYGVILLRNYNWGTTSWDIGPKVLLRKLVDFEKSKSAIVL
jgi:CubicO group peptidase (beta-lactamase class C family)